MARLEVQQANPEFITLFSRGSEKEPFADFLNGVSFTTVSTQAFLGAVSLMKDYQDIAQERSFNLQQSAETAAPIVIPIVGTLLAFQWLYEKYKSLNVEEKLRTQERAADVRRNPLSILKKS